MLKQSSFVVSPNQKVAESAPTTYFTRPTCPVESHNFQTKYEIFQLSTAAPKVWLPPTPCWAAARRRKGSARRTSRWSPCPERSTTTSSFLEVSLTRLALQIGPYRPCPGQEILKNARECRESNQGPIS